MKTDRRFSPQNLTYIDKLMSTETILTYIKSKIVPYMVTSEFQE